MVIRIAMTPSLKASSLVVLTISSNDRVSRRVPRSCSKRTTGLVRPSSMTGGLQFAMNTTDLVVRDMDARDWPAVRAIYEEGIATGEATFQTEAPSWSAWDAGHLADCRLVAESDRVLGWAALSRVSDRCVYAGVAEVSVYVAAAARGRGIGSLLLDALIRRSEECGLWTLQAGIFPENTRSIVVHERCGFRVVGRRERLGQMDGRWRDVLLLERRSPSVGTDRSSRGQTENKVR
jgi:L-amino acid N-acyltransferase YncA